MTLNLEDSWRHCVWKSLYRSPWLSVKVCLYKSPTPPESRDLIGKSVEYTVICCVVAFCDPMDCSQRGSRVHGVSQVRILGWVAFSITRASSQPSDWTQVSCVGRWVLFPWTTREAHRQIVFTGLGFTAHCYLEPFSFLQSSLCIRNYELVFAYSETRGLKFILGVCVWLHPNHSPSWVCCKPSTVSSTTGNHTFH